jgi:hypothetical protein
VSDCKPIAVGKEEMTSIETARTLLADASPELRKAVGELVIAANMVGYNYGHVTGQNAEVIYVDTKDEYAEDRKYEKFARELLEGGKHDRMLYAERMNEEVDVEVKFVYALLQIIDSQAEEIERLNTENNARSLVLDAARSEIERLTKERDEAKGNG